MPDGGHSYSPNILRLVDKFLNPASNNVSTCSTFIKWVYSRMIRIEAAAETSQSAFSIS